MQENPFARARVIGPREVMEAAKAAESPTVYPAPGTEPGMLNATELVAFARRCPAWAAVEVVGAHGKIQPASRLELVIGGDTHTGPVVRIYAFPAEDHDPARGKPTSLYEEAARTLLAG